MTDEPSALARMPSPPVEEADDYDAIAATIMASTRGRWFLQEYARRNRHADTQQVLAAVARIEDVIRERSGEPYQSFRGELLEMAKVIADTRVKEIEPQAPAEAERADSPTGEAAQSPAVAAAERIRDVAWSLRERGYEPATCEQIEALATAVLSASALRDPADRRAQQLADVLGYLERRIETMLASAAAPPAQPEPVEEPPLLASETVVAPPPSEPPAEPPPVVRAILTVQSEIAAPRSSASLLEGLNAFSESPTTHAMNMSAAPLAAAADSVAALAAPLPDVSSAPAEAAATPDADWAAPLRRAPFEAAREEGGPPPQPPSAEPAPRSAPVARPSPATADAPLAALMALSDEERIALFT